MSPGQISSTAPRTDARVAYDPAPLYARFSDGNQKLSLAGSRAFYAAAKNEFKEHHGGKMNLQLKQAIRPSKFSGIRANDLQNFSAKLGEQRTQSLNPIHNQSVNDSTRVGQRTKLGQGKFNVVYKCKFRDKDVATGLGGGTRELVVKDAKPQLYKGGEITIQRGVGISGKEPRIIDRNVATTTVNSHMGTRSVPEAQAGSLDGRPVVAMSVAPGITAKAFYLKDPDIVLNGDFRHQMSDVEVNAYLCANPDPHSENIMVKADYVDGRYRNVQVTMVDNDMSFGGRMSNPDQSPEFFADQRTYRQTGLPAYMDVKTCENIKKMDVDKCVQDLGRNLTPGEVTAFKSRVDHLKAHVAFLESNNRVVTDWDTFTNAAGEALAGGDFFNGTMQMSGVQQGEKDGQPRVVPRSMILRDIGESPTAFNEAVPIDLCQAIEDFNTKSGTSVPPSGSDFGISRSNPSTSPTRTDGPPQARDRTGGLAIGGHRSVENGGQGSGYQRTPVSTNATSVIAENGSSQVQGSGETDDYTLLSRRDTEEPYNNVEEEAPYNNIEQGYSLMPGSGETDDYTLLSRRDTEEPYNNVEEEAPYNNVDQGYSLMPGSGEMDDYTLLSRRDIEEPYNNVEEEPPYNNVDQARDTNGGGGGWVRARPSAISPGTNPTVSRVSDEPRPVDRRDAQEVDLQLAPGGTSRQEPDDDPTPVGTRQEESGYNLTPVTTPPRQNADYELTPVGTARPGEADYHLTPNSGGLEDPGRSDVQTRPRSNAVSGPQPSDLTMMSRDFIRI